jgi:hypothetical protein
MGAAGALAPCPEPATGPRNTSASAAPTGQELTGPIGAGALIVELAARPDLRAAAALPRGAARKSAAWNAIVASAAAAQAPYLRIAQRLEQQGQITAYRTLASPAALILTPAPLATDAVRGAFELAGVSGIFNNDDASQLWPQQPGAAPPSPPDPNGDWWGLESGPPEHVVSTAPTQRPYGVTMVGAPAAWAQGAAGHGLVYGSVDTGADYTHEALVGQYRGNLGNGQFSHDYNWMDAGLNPSPTPYDPSGHGTHTIGTVVGHTATSDIGVAPWAHWIAARALTGTVDAALRALQWMQAPTKLDGTAPRPDLAPDVVGLSWYMGSPTQTLFQDSIRNLRAAGIEVVKSAGNTGPAAGTITSPGQFPEVITVGAVDQTGAALDESSRGPAPFPLGGATPKPDLAAPGGNVLSALPGNRYGEMSGTSMAQPHVAGAILDLLSRFPQLTHDQLLQALGSSARDAGAPGVDPVFGRGIINIGAAVNAAAALTAPQRFSVALPTHPHRSTDAA